MKIAAIYTIMVFERTYVGWVPFFGGCFIAVIGFFVTTIGIIG